MILGQYGAIIGPVASPCEVCTFPTNQPLYQGADDAGRTWPEELLVEAV